MTALAQAIITRATRIDTNGTLTTVVLFSGVGLLVTLCAIRFGLDYGMF